MWGQGEEAAERVGEGTQRCGSHTGQAQTGNGLTPVSRSWRWEALKWRCADLSMWSSSQWTDRLEKQKPWNSCHSEQVSWTCRMQWEPWAASAPSWLNPRRCVYILSVVDCNTNWDSSVAKWCGLFTIVVLCHLHYLLRNWRSLSQMWAVLVSRICPLIMAAETALASWWQPAQN